MNQVLEVLALAIIFAAPFGEGGRAPAMLCALQALSLGIIFLPLLLPRGGGRAYRWGAAARPLISGLTAALGLCILAALRASYPLGAAFGLLDLAVPAGLFLALLRAPADPRLVARLRTGIALSTLLQAGLALFRWTRAAGLAAGALAAGASFLNPDHLGAFLNLGLILWLSQALEALERGERRRGFVGLLSVALHLFAILVLMSRGALVGLAAALFLLLVSRLRTGSVRGRLVAGLVLGLVLTLGSGMVILRFARGDDPYRYQRLSIWRASIGLLAERPLLGFGPGMFRYEGPR
ncbi:MAG TPA: O-antigen ligase family protein, partial [Candidatus Polarisedimenticolia bacterium]